MTNTEKKTDEHFVMQALVFVDQKTPLKRDIIFETLLSFN